ncbi:MAG: hypothetical protein K6G69_01115 [Lachnospiraceae bacterium]|nr:hypothetical protein [Lachnospiraceae bacterium]
MRLKRFDKHKKLHMNTLVLTAAVFAAFIIIFVYAVSRVETRNLDREDDILRSALERDIIHCYAIEGFYPPSLEYIVENYGLIYDKDAYIVDYRPIGNNMYPNFSIIKKGDSDE